MGAPEKVETDTPNLDPWAQPAPPGETLAQKVARIAESGGLMQHEAETLREAAKVIEAHAKETRELLKVVAKVIETARLL